MHLSCDIIWREWPFCEREMLDLCDIIYHVVLIPGHEISRQKLVRPICDNMDISGGDLFHGPNLLSAK